jgi:hypothetical protein
VRSISTISKPRSSRCSIFRPRPWLRVAKWIFEELSTIRKSVIQRAGRLTRPQGKLTLTLGPNQTAKASILQFMDAGTA